ncbi:MAG: hypothetical protein AB7F96_08860 [Beijerinckiaceae bacterium]
MANTSSVLGTRIFGIVVEYPRSLHPEHGDCGAGSVFGLFEHTLGVIGGSFGVVQGEGNENHAYTSYEKHPKRPKGHFLLGFQVLLFAGVLLGGFYYLNRAIYLRFNGAISNETFFLYLCAGICGLFGGLYFFADLYASML